MRLVGCCRLSATIAGVADPLLDRDALDGALELASREARRYLDGIADQHVMLPGTEAAVELWSDPMPEAGDGALAALTELTERARQTARARAGRASSTS